METEAIQSYRKRFKKLILMVESAMAEAITGFVPAKSQASLLRAIGISGRHETVGSKRLRGTLFLLIHSFSNCESLKCMHLAASIELIHSASLLLDDLQDEHPTRWNVPTRWMAVGKAQAFNDIVLLVAIAEKLSERESEEFSLNDCLLRMIRGQEEDLRAKEFYSLEMKGYLHIVQEKTATLFEHASMKGGHWLPETSRSLLAKCGSALGIAHQIQDDLDDLRANTPLECLPESNFYWFIRNKLGSEERKEAIEYGIDVLDSQNAIAQKALKSAKLPNGLMGRLEQLCMFITYR